MKIEYPDDALFIEDAEPGDLSTVMAIHGCQIQDWHTEGSTIVFEVETENHEHAEIRVCP